jgi:hypothetical protein
MHVNKLIVALAAKIARIAWVILTRPGAVYERRDPAFPSEARPPIARFEEEEATLAIRGCGPFRKTHKQCLRGKWKSLSFIDARPKHPESDDSYS